MSGWQVLAAVIGALVVLIVASKVNGSLSGWSALVRRFATAKRLEGRKGPILDRHVLGLSAGPSMLGSSREATRLLVSDEGLYIESTGVRGMGSARVLVPWSEVVWLPERKSLWRESVTLRLGHAEAYLAVTPEAFERIRCHLMTRAN